MIKYIFDGDMPLTVNSAAKASPQKIGEALQAISSANSGRLTPKAVVENASNPKHALHRFFQWDDAKAAHAFRLEQARELIRVVRIADDNGASPRAFLSVNDNGTSYRSHADVKASPSLQEIVLKSALRDLRAFEARYREMQDVCEDVRSAQRKVGAKLKATEEQRAAA